MHHWQDIVLALGSLVFSAALLPSIRSKHKPHISTSLLTAGVLLVYVIVYATLSLWYTMVAMALNATLWLILAGQRVWISRS